MVLPLLHYSLCSDGYSAHIQLNSILLRSSTYGSVASLSSVPAQQYSNIASVEYDELMVFIELRDK